MKPIDVWCLSCAALLATTAAAQSDPPAVQRSLELQADATCELQIGGRRMGMLSPGTRQVVVLPPAAQEVVCTSLDWPEVVVRERLDQQAGETRPLRLRLRWTDAADGVLDRAQRLLWTRQDNGADIDWTEASTWCRDKGAGWRLPRRAELESLVAGAAGETTPCRGAQCKAPVLFTLSSYWMWSGDRDAAGRVWYVYLHTGHTANSAPDYRLQARALCVRPA